MKAVLSHIMSDDYWCVETTKFEVFFYSHDMAIICGFGGMFEYFTFLKNRFNMNYDGHFKTEQDCQNAINWVEPKLIMYKLGGESI
jgi:hypothetical protein